MNPAQLQKIPIFSDLPYDQLNHICKYSVTQDYKKNFMVMFSDEPETKFFIILNGRVKISRFSEDGRETIFSFLGEGNFFGEMSVYEDQYSEVNVMTIEPSRILYIHRTDLLPVLTLFPQMAINLLKEMTHKLRQRDDQIKSLALQNATGKVANTLLHLVDDIGSIRLGSVELARLPTHRDIANMLGTSRETISRAMKTLMQHGYIRKEDDRLIICDYQHFRASFT